MSMPHARFRFRCARVDPVPGSDARSVILVAEQGAGLVGFREVPAGTLDVTLSGPESAALFREGESYHVMITRAES